MNSTYVGVTLYGRMLHAEKLCSFSAGAVENDRKHVVLCVWEPWNKYSMNHKGLANKHGMHRMLLEDGSLQRRTMNMQGNNLDAPTLFIT